MSWADEHPEQYQALCNHVVAGKLLNYDTVADEHHALVLYTLEEMPNTAIGRLIYGALLGWARDEIHEALSSHYAEQFNDPRMEDDHE